MQKPAEKSKKNDSFTGLRRRTVEGILHAWRGIKGSARQVIGAEFTASLPKEETARLKTRMQDCLEPRGGEVSARSNAVELGRIYLGLDGAGKEKFLKILATDFDVNHAQVDACMEALHQATGKAERAKAEEALRSALISPRRKILQRFNTLPDGFKFLVDMREDVQPLLKEDPTFQSLDNDLKALLSNWFDIGLLDMEQIAWDSPAALLEKLIAYEAVHEIRSWNDLKNRLDSDRRCFAFFHSKMPLEPLIFVEVALTRGMAGNIQELLDESQPLTDPEEADTAIFYSISNAQAGLAGISFGNFLIKRVVDRLTRDFRNIKTFATLSPVPGFRKWLDPMLMAGKEQVLLPIEVKAIQHISGLQLASKALLDMLGSPWHTDPLKAEALRPILMRLCAHYLMQEKRDNRALDAVAHFHLTNGAVLERINWLGDTSPKGFKQSAGIMVNYHYKLSDIDENHESYARGGVVNASRAVRGLVRG